MVAVPFPTIVTVVTLLMATLVVTTCKLSLLYVIAPELLELADKVKFPEPKFLEIFPNEMVGAIGFTVIIAVVLPVV